MPADSWLLLIHQLPPKPPYLRVKVWRRLQGLGAVPLKNSVYLLPSTDEAREDFEWVLREIHKERGEASLCEARLVEGLTDEEVRGLFLRAREEDYRTLASAVRKFVHETVSPRVRSLSDEVRSAADVALTRFRRRLEEIARIDFFGAPGRGVVEGLIAGLAQRISAEPAPTEGGDPARSLSMGEAQKRTWVTRKGIHIDRIACAWLIRRFIDKQPTFKFVPARGYTPAARELRFDMFDAEFTHDGDRCSFEVMLRAFDLRQPALQALAEVVHDIDLKDSKFNREETPGVDHLIAGIAWLDSEDEARLAHGTAVFDALHSYFLRRKSAGRSS
jgi:hypothetical protein